MPAPSTPILDNFNRADSSLPLDDPTHWGSIHPGGQLGYTDANGARISSFQVLDNNVGSASKMAVGWVAATFGDSEAYWTISTLFGDFMGVALRAVNLNTTSVKYYAVNVVAAGGWEIERLDNDRTETILANGTDSAWLAGDKLGANAYTSSGNVVLEMWRNRGGTWSMLHTTTDSSASKLTAPGSIGMIIGNASSENAGRADDFGGGTITFPSTDILQMGSVSPQLGR